MEKKELLELVNKGNYEGLSNSMSGVLKKYGDPERVINE